MVPVLDPLGVKRPTRITRTIQALCSPAALAESSRVRGLTTGRPQEVEVCKNLRHKSTQRVTVAASGRLGPCRERRKLTAYPLMSCLIGSWADPPCQGARGKRLLFGLSADVR
jgi:hypothetical protein